MLLHHISFSEDSKQFVLKAQSRLTKADIMMVY